MIIFGASGVGSGGPVRVGVVGQEGQMAGGDGHRRGMVGEENGMGGRDSRVQCSCWGWYG